MVGRDNPKTSSRVPSSVWYFSYCLQNFRKIFSPCFKTYRSTLSQLSLRILLFVISANHLSTILSHEECIGIKCNTNRPSHFSIYSCTYANNAITIDQQLIPFVVTGNTATMTMAEDEDSMITTFQRVNSPTVVEIKATKKI